jgi:hypothetical protein
MLSSRKPLKLPGSFSPWQGHCSVRHTSWPGAHVGMLCSFSSVSSTGPVHLLRRRLCGSWAIDVGTRGVARISLLGPPARKKRAKIAAESQTSHNWKRNRSRNPIFQRPARCRVDVRVGMTDKKGATFRLATAVTFLSIARRG